MVKRDGAPPAVAPGGEAGPELATASAPVTAPGLVPGVGGPGPGGGPEGGPPEDGGPQVPPLFHRGSAPPPSPVAGAPAAPITALGIDGGADGPHPETRARPIERSSVASLRGIFTAVVIAAAALAGATATRALPDWEAGRWWMLTAGLDVIAVVSSVLAVVLAVGALGEIARHRSVLRGVVPATVGLLLGCALVVGAGTRAGVDWDELDVPAAWDRLRLGQSETRTFADFVDGARGASTATAGSLRTEGRVGGCYQGTPEAPGAEVGCGEPHTVELVDQIALTAGVEDDVAVRQEAGREQCGEALEGRLDDVAAAGQLVALVPNEVAWLAGDRNGVCVLSFSSPVEGRAGP